MAIMKSPPSLTTPSLDKTQPHDLFGGFILNPSTLSVAKENFTASKPPIRNLNVTHEILTLLKSQEVKQKLSQTFAEHASQNKLAFIHPKPF